MDPDRPHDEDVVVLPAAPVDLGVVEAVEDALAGEPEPTSPYDATRSLGSDPHDFAGLYIRHRSSFGAQARRFLRDPRDVDEVLQEAFLRLFLALPELDNELQALAYCRRTITNLCIDRYRADQRRPRLVDLESVPTDVLTEDEQGDPVVQAEDAAVVREALALLTPLHRQALVKREVEEKPLPVIAAELGVPEDSVKHLLHRARRALRRRLAETHLAPGVDLDDVPTLSLLARSAVSSSGRLGVLALVLAGLVAGTTTRGPVQAIDTISGLWKDKGVPTAPRRPRPAPLPGAVRQPAGVLGLPRDLPDAVQVPVAAPTTTPAPGSFRGAASTSTGTVTTLPVHPAPHSPASSPHPTSPPAQSVVLPPLQAAAPSQEPSPSTEPESAESPRPSAAPAPSNDGDAPDRSRTAR